jgi:hypothetical protein
MSQDKQTAVDPTRWPFDPLPPAKPDDRPQRPEGPTNRPDGTGRPGSERELQNPSQPKQEQ